MQTLPIRISSPKVEGLLQASKWLKVQVLLDENEMQELLKTLGEVHFVHVSSPVLCEEALISAPDFLKKYCAYVQQLKNGQIPIIDQFKSYFSSNLSASLDPFYAISVGNNKLLIKTTKPVIQLQAHHFFYSNLSGTFHPMVLSQDSISWGLQFSYPQFFQDPHSRQIVKTSDRSLFPNTSLFATLMRWMRSNTLATPFIAGGKRTNSPIRVGKQALGWIQDHPQLKSAQIQLKKL